MDRASNPRLLIGGEWRPGAAAIPVNNPYTGEVIGAAPLGDANLVESAITAAATAFPKVRAVPPHARASLLARVAERLEARRLEFIEMIIAEAGKPVVFAEAEVGRAITTFRVASEEARRSGGEVLDLDAFPSGDGHLGIARRFPIGVIAAITPFNFPLNLVAHKVAPSLATNNTMVVKPSTKTPLTALLLAEVTGRGGTAGWTDQLRDMR